MFIQHRRQEPLYRNYKNKDQRSMQNDLLLLYDCDELGDSVRMACEESLVHALESCVRKTTGNYFKGVFEELQSNKCRKKRKKAHTCFKNKAFTSGTHFKVQLIKITS